MPAAPPKPAAFNDLPLFSDLPAAQRQNLPTLTVRLHAYAAQPRDRLVDINNNLLREGETFPPGIRVEAITPDGLVLSHQNLRFRYPVQ